MANSKTQKIIKDTKGNEVVTIRTDKTLKDFMETKPSSRWNPEFWYQKYDDNINELLRTKYTVNKVGDFEEKLTYGAIVTGSQKYYGRDYYLINQGDISFTGLDLSNARHVKKESPWVIERAMPKVDSIILARSGVGGVGKNRITIITKPIKAVVDSFVDLLDLNREKVNPYFVVVFWKSKFGWLQIERIINGVGTINISFDEIREINIPVLPDGVQKNIESEYKKMSVFHDKAIKAKKKGDGAGYKKNIETAEKMLKDLISKTEAVIRGERDDVI